MASAAPPARSSSRAATRPSSRPNTMTAAKATIWRFLPPSSQGGNPQGLADRQADRHARKRQGTLLAAFSSAEKAYGAELDINYKRQDMSAQHTYESRKAFALCLRQGESGLNLAEAALQIAAEDDAIVSHSAVAFPVDAYLGRVQKMADELGRLRLSGLPPDTAEPAQVLKVVDKYLYEEQRLRIPRSGRSNLPEASKVAHPGVWEEPRHAYLNEALTRRVATPACLAILYSDIMQRLLSKGAVSFAVRMECREFDQPPTPVVLEGLSKAMLTRPDGTIMNTCTMDALDEVLMHLKRSYWPFSWEAETSDGGNRGASYGGFNDAARAALDGMQSAEMEAIARTAAHRLSRGIWTSPGAGDLRRSKAAAERLCMLVGDSETAERRDLAILHVHSGEFARGQAELKAYMASAAAKAAPTSTRVLVGRLSDMLDETLKAAPERGLRPLSVESCLEEGPPTPMDPSQLQDLPW